LTEVYEFHISHYVKYLSGLRLIFSCRRISLQCIWRISTYQCILFGSKCKI